MSGAVTDLWRSFSKAQSPCQIIVSATSAASENLIKLNQPWFKPDWQVFLFFYFTNDYLPWNRCPLLPWYVTTRSNHLRVDSSQQTVCTHASTTSLYHQRRTQRLWKGFETLFKSLAAKERADNTTINTVAPDNDERGARRRHWYVFLFYFFLYLNRLHVRPPLSLM